jgi:hypothetical protein
MGKRKEERGVKEEGKIALEFLTGFSTSFP